MASRTQIVCMCEGQRGQSIDEVFINRLMKSLGPPWLRPWSGSNTIRLKPCGGRRALIEEMPKDSSGGASRPAATRPSWSGPTVTMTVPTAKHSRPLSGKRQSDRELRTNNSTKWCSRLRKTAWKTGSNSCRKGNTDEAIEGPRVTNNRDVAEAAKKLAEMCKAGKLVQNLPPSLKWSCQNWNTLKGRMKSS